MKSQIRFVSIFLALALVLPALAQAGGTVPKEQRLRSDRPVRELEDRQGRADGHRSVAHDVISAAKYDSQGFGQADVSGVQLQVGCPLRQNFTCGCTQ